MTSAEELFRGLVHEIRNLLDCELACLLTGCSEPALQHPLLDLLPARADLSTNGTSHATSATCNAGSYDSAAIATLLRHERVRALCDLAIQTGRIQDSHSVQIHANEFFVQSVIAAPLESPAGLLGLFLLIDRRPHAFLRGERLLLGSYLQAAALRLEQELRRICTVQLHSYLKSDKDKNESMVLQDALLDLQRQDAFLSVIGHELRMPLSSIKGYAGLLQAYGTTEGSDPQVTHSRQGKYLQTIIEQADHLAVLISDVLDVSRISAGRLALHVTSVDVGRLCQQLVELAQERADRQGPGKFHIRCLLAPQLPPAWADPHRLQQVLTNLLENAIKYSPEGGVIEVEVSSGGSASSTRAQPMLCISVRDQGIGIAQEQQSRIFQPFGRVENPANASVAGTGLGLYITRKLVEAMGGAVRLHSSEGHGTTMLLTLPLARCEVSLSLAAQGRSGAFPLIPLGNAASAPG